MRPGSSHELRCQTRVLRILFLQNGAWSEAGMVFVPHRQNGVSDRLAVLKEEKGARGQFRQIGDATHHEILAQASRRNGSWKSELRLNVRQVFRGDDGDFAMVRDFCTLPESMGEEELFTGVDESAARVTITSGAMADENLELGDGS